MARPPKLNAEWFTHAGELRNDRRVKAMRATTGAAGYGIFHMLLESLTHADHTQLLVDEMELELLAGDFGVSVTEIRSLLQIGQKVGYFHIDDAHMLTCPELNKWLEMHFEKRNRSRNTSRSGSLSQPVAGTGVSVTETPHNTIQYNTEHNSTPTPPTPAGEGCVLEVLDAKKNSEALERPSAPASHTEGGATDVATSVDTRPEFRPEPDWAPQMRQLAAQLIVYWNVSEHQQQARMALTRFARTLFERDQGPLLQTQFAAYRAYKELTGERPHGWPAYCGKEADAYQSPDAAWNLQDWTAALAAARNNPKYARTQQLASHAGGNGSATDSSRRHIIPARINYENDAA